MKLDELLYQARKEHGDFNVLDALSQKLHIKFSDISQVNEHINNGKSKGMRQVLKNLVPIYNPTSNNATEEFAELLNLQQKLSEVTFAIDCANALGINDASMRRDKASYIPDITPE